MNGFVPFLRSGDDEGAVELHGVCLRFGRQALSDIDLRVCAGERIALVGSNGSGKSSLLRVLHGLLPPSAGLCAAHIGAPGDGVPASVHAAHFGQNNVALDCGWEVRLERGAQAGAASAGAGWHGRAWRGAMRAPCRADSSNAWRWRVPGRRQPDLWLLDEPTASLDPHAKREVEALMAAFAAGGAESGMTMVFASHNLGQVKRLASRVVYLERGRVLADLPVDYFFNSRGLRPYPRRPICLSKENSYEIE
jgi:tungstate transport system ATP-binding protein